MTNLRQAYRIDSLQSDVKSHQDCFWGPMKLSVFMFEGAVFKVVGGERHLVPHLRKFCSSRPP